MLAALDYYGGAQFFEIAAAGVQQLWLRNCRCVLALPLGAGAAVRLVDARTAPLGAEHHHVGNESETEDLDVKDHTGTVLRTIGPKQIVRVWLQDDATEAGVWAVTQPRDFTQGGKFE